MDKVHAVFIYHSHDVHVDYFNKQDEYSLQFNQKIFLPYHQFIAAARNDSKEMKANTVNASNSWTYIGETMDDPTMRHVKTGRSILERYLYGFLKRLYLERDSNQKADYCRPDFIKLKLALSNNQVRIGKIDPWIFSWKGLAIDNRFLLCYFVANYRSSHRHSPESCCDMSSEQVCVHSHDILSDMLIFKLIL